MKQKTARSKRAKRHVAASPTSRPQTKVGNQPYLFDISVEPSAPPSWPSISACIIARNEASNLPACIHSLADLPSEIIVVDTGSTDNTPYIARSLGALVFHFPWIDDFSAARNHSLHHASKQWIFWLDADDRLSPKAVAQLKQAAASDIADAYCCWVSSATPAGVCEVTDHVRLFRNGLGIAFSGAIHETVVPDLARLGLRVARTDIEIEHTGYASPEIRQRKAERNLRVIERQITLHPNDPDLVFYRGQARGTTNLEGLKADMREFLARTQPNPIFDSKRFWAYATLASAVRKADGLEPARALLTQALGEFPDHPYLLLQLADVDLAESHAEKALMALKLALHGLKGPVPGLRPEDAAVELKLAECHRALGQLQQAIQWAEQAATHSRDRYQVDRLLARLYLESGRLADAESLITRLLASATTAEPWLLLAELRHLQGRWGEPSEALEEAKTRGLPEAAADELLARMKAARVLAATRTERALPPEQTATQMRGLAFLAKGEQLKAAECFAAAIKASPQNPDNYRYLAVALEELGREAEAMEAWRLATYWTSQA